MDRLIENVSDRRRLIKFLEHQRMPFVIKVTSGRMRSVEQNRLAHLWYMEAAQQLGDRTAVEVKAYCKLHFGIPLLCAENEEYRKAYERKIAPLPYEEQINRMMPPLEIEVTRLMTTKQLGQYLDAVSQHFAEFGVELTQPDDQGLSSAA